MLLRRAGLTASAGLSMKIPTYTASKSMVLFVLNSENSNNVNSNV